MKKHLLPSFGIIGGGAWRAQFYLRIARDLPGIFPFAGFVDRDPEKRTKISQKWGLPVYASIEELLDKGKPDFVVTTVPWSENLPVVKELSQSKVATLSETPVAPTMAELKQMSQLVTKGAKIQVAEQYPFQPNHAAALSVVRSGRLGTVYEADISFAHGYHGISLLRNYLQVGLRLPKITARRVTTKIINGPGRNGPPTEEKLQDSPRIIAQLDYGDRFGVFDFSDDQYFSWIRSSRRLVRGDRGEINQDEVRFLKDFKTPITDRFCRRDTGHDGNLEGYYHASISLAGDVLYTNPFPEARLSDDEIAVATCLSKMQTYVQTGQPFYSVEEASYDRYFDLLINEAADTSKPIQAKKLAQA